MKLLARFAIAAAALAAVAPAQASVFALNGDTTGGPTFNRPLDGDPPAGLSGVGTAVHYSTVTFTVGAAGNYLFSMSSIPPDYDPFLALYANSFDPSSPLTNALIANDDFSTGNVTLSGFFETLTAGTTYVAVLTGFDNQDFGAFSFAIVGPGDIAASVPEPASWGLLLVGLGMVGGVARQRARVSRVTYA